MLQNEVLKMKTFKKKIKNLQWAPSIHAATPFVYVD